MASLFVVSDVICGSGDSEVPKSAESCGADFTGHQNHAQELD